MYDNMFMKMNGGHTARRSSAGHHWLESPTRAHRRGLETEIWGLKEVKISFANCFLETFGVGKTYLCTTFLFKGCFLECASVLNSFAPIQNAIWGWWVLTETTSGLPFEADKVVESLTEQRQEQLAFGFVLLVCLLLFVVVAACGGCCCRRCLFLFVCMFFFRFKCLQVSQTR